MSELANIAQQFSGLPMESLIGGPLTAAAEANARMATTQTEFILRTGFNSTKKKIKKKEWSDNGWKEVDVDEASYEPIMINLEMVRPSLDEKGNQLLINEVGADGKKTDKLVAAPPAIFQIKVPLLSVIPINSLAVQSVDIHFEMEVKSSFEETNKEASNTKKEGSASLEASAGWGFAKVSIKGSASYSSEDSKSRDTHYQKSNNAKYVVDVKAGQLPLPTGITTILDIYAKNIVPTAVASIGTEVQPS